MREEALKSNTPWMCVSCYHCVVRCPQEIHITDVMYAIKCMAIEAKLYQRFHRPGFLTNLYRHGGGVWTQLRAGSGFPTLSQTFCLATSEHDADGLGHVKQKADEFDAETYQAHGSTQSGFSTR